MANEIDTVASEFQENSQPFHGWHSNLEEEGNDEDGLDDRFLDLQRKLEEKSSQTKNDEEYAKTLEDTPKSPRPSTSVPTNSINTASKQKTPQLKFYFPLSSSMADVRETKSTQPSGTISLPSSSSNNVSDIEDTQEMLEELKNYSDTCDTQEILAEFNGCCDELFGNKKFVEQQKQFEQQILQVKADEEFARKLQKKIEEEEKLQRSDVMTRNRTPVKSSKTLGVKRQMSIEELMSPASVRSPKRQK